MLYTGDNTYYTVREAAQRSGLSLQTWYKGGGGTAKIPRIRYGRAIRLLRVDVERFILERIFEAEQAVGRSFQPSSNTAPISSVSE